MTTKIVASQFDASSENQRVEESEKILVVLRSHVGPKNAISRPRVAQITGLTERTVRLCIEYLRKNNGVMVCYAQCLGGGYYLAERVADLEACRNTELSREEHVRANREFFDGAAKEAQLSLI